MTSERKTILDIRDLQITLPAGGDRPHALWDFNLTNCWLTQASAIA